MLAKTLRRAGIGFLLGVAIGYIISILTNLHDPDVFVPVSDNLLRLAGSLPAALVLQGVFSGLYGAVCFGAMSFYEIERLPLALATAAHCAAIVLTYIPGAFLLGWVSSPAEVLLIAGMQLIVFFIIWIILYLNYKAQVKKLNEMQAHFKHGNQGQNGKTRQ